MQVTFSFVKKTSGIFKGIFEKIWQASPVNPQGAKKNPNAQGVFRGQKKRP